MPEEMSEAFGGAGKHGSSDLQREPESSAENSAAVEASMRPEGATDGSGNAGSGQERSKVNLPAIWRNPLWRKVRAAAAAVGVLLAVGALVWAMGAKFHESLGAGVDKILEYTGFKAQPVGAGLTLDQIRSERRFESGGMQLIVEGQVRNTSSETVTVPDIQARALGPDRSVIQSWRIEAPVATLPPGVSVPFHSSIVAPEGAVAEVNLNFIEPQHDR